MRVSVRERCCRFEVEGEGSWIVSVTQDAKEEIRSGRHAQCRFSFVLTLGEAGRGSRKMRVGRGILSGYRSKAVVRTDGRLRPSLTHSGHLCAGSCSSLSRIRQRS